ncbi:hypothetical protein A2Z33_03120 [Candidatus Gottesmanbacteria bacterium RBG_16_52_11]|uniref:phosphoserine phosphatase n=1 Tax=Candidatus Gottesmanbacteria bacterium RBG_16_52_11 TaxID=1798374 RepID=A0A1F5YVD1_9BACT|nr:MAG: hypothetical protein A2Z33_03120 [Candidatus Gottesmanbacteria bacterium RBG_16_52_11]
MAADREQIRNVKIVALDVDGTLATGNFWQKMHALTGITLEEDDRWFRDYYSKVISFESWAETIALRYRDSRIPISKFRSLISVVRIVPGAGEVVQKLKEHYKLCLISSNVDFYVAHVARRLGISRYYANYRLNTDANGIVTDITYTAPEDKAKVIALKDMCREHTVVPSQVVFVGDSDNDIPAFAFTGRGILVGEGNRELRRLAWKRIKTISELPEILGIE